MNLRDLNPGWIAAGALIISVPTHIAVSQALSARDAQENREFRVHQREWNASIEARISNDKLETREALVGLKKDMESALKGVASIQQALMVRPNPSSTHNP